MQFHTTSSTDISPKDESQKNTVLKGNRKRNKKPRGRSVLKFIITAIFTITFGFVINYLWLEYQKPNLSIQFSIGTEYRQNSFEKDQTIYYQVLTDNLRDCIVTRAMTSGDNRVFGRIDETAEVFIIFIIKNDGRSHINKFRLG
ncbi:MAG: hypothetical protein KJ971_04705, partial [Firmicutes bacterium]|nr:hypothetical protein [Bacillota bacterium]